MENICRFNVGELRRTRYYGIMIILIDFIDFFLMRCSIYVSIHANLVLNLCKKKKFALPDL